MRTSDYDVIVVGAGIAGLTASAYLSKEKHRVLLVEKEPECGGLLGAFKLDGHIIDKGARGIIDSGIVFSMMKQLGVDIEFLSNPVKMAVGSKSILLKDESSIDEYGSLLKELYPNEKKDIDEIFFDVKRVMKYMDVLYGIDNPLFMSKPYDMKYLGKVLLPWMGKFIINMNKAMKMFEPVNDYLSKKTQNKALIHIIAQHFFTDTPTFFALSYFTLYLQYHYPKGSTQVIVDKLSELIKQQDGIILTNTQVMSIDSDKKEMMTQDGQVFGYQQMIWTGDTNAFYKVLQTESISNDSVRQKVNEKKALFKVMKGADSILSLVILVNQPLETYREFSGPHCFYTKRLEGLSNVKLSEIQDDQKKFSTDKKVLFDWIKKYIEYNTFEISIPALRDASLSPKGETGLIVSTLFDFDLTKHIADLGFYEEFKQFITEAIIEFFNDEYWLNFKSSITKTLVATPLTIQSRTFSTDGSVTGWSFGNHPFPVEYKFLKVSKAVLTPVASIKQAGQFTFNPAGVPVAILTGKLAADAVDKDLKKLKKRQGKVT
ncbi:MAG: phytoene dehydrogenase-like oxidoreductase [Erysipelotrichaceae bacterium]|nr:MAG: phytoene dehydrogenase-like [Erysipelotrichaceae bacterium]TXT18592.1 MAG: phytoene dehydrogenase-like oxidoreductase [Erysipelotrichaceae bacterium]